MVTIKCYGHTLIRLIEDGVVEDEVIVDGEEIIEYQVAKTTFAVCVHDAPFFRHVITVQVYSSRALSWNRTWLRMPFCCQLNYPEYPLPLFSTDNSSLLQLAYT